MSAPLGSRQALEALDLEASYAQSHVAVLYDLLCDNHAQGEGLNDPAGGAQRMYACLNAVKVHLAGIRDGMDRLWQGAIDAPPAPEKTDQKETLRELDCTVQLNYDRAAADVRAIKALLKERDSLPNRQALAALVDSIYDGFTESMNEVNAFAERRGCNFVAPPSDTVTAMQEAIRAGQDAAARRR